MGPRSVAALREGLSSTDFEERSCPDSYHVATLDNDAEMIFDASLAFVRAHSPAMPERG